MVRPLNPTTCHSLFLLGHTGSSACPFHRISIPQSLKRCSLPSFPDFVLPASKRLKPVLNLSFHHQPMVSGSKLSLLEIGNDFTVLMQLFLVCLHPYHTLLAQAVTTAIFKKLKSWRMLHWETALL